MRRARAVLCVLAAAATLLGTLERAPAEVLTIHQGWINLTSVLSPIVFEKKDIMAHYGKTYVVDAIHFNSSAAMLTAFANGDIDISVGGHITLGLAVENARLDDIRVVADGFQDGVAGHLSTPFLVRNDSGIATVEDLKGKVLATNGLGGTPDIALRVLLRRHGMEDKKDYTAIEAPQNALWVMLLERKVDLMGNTPPTIYEKELRKNAHVLFTMADAFAGPSAMGVLFARAGFLAKNRAAVADYYEDMVRGFHWFLDPANRTDVLAIVERATKLPPDRFADWIYTEKDYYRDPDAMPNLTAMQSNMAVLKANGFLKTDIDVRKYADLSFAHEAARRIKAAP